MRVTRAATVAAHPPSAVPLAELESAEWDMLFRAVVARLRLLVPAAPPVVGSLQGSAEDCLQALESLQALRQQAPTIVPLRQLVAAKLGSR